MKNYFFLMLLLLCGAVANVTSQVTNRENKVSENYSVPELINNGSNGLRMDTANITLEGNPCGTYDHSAPPVALSDGSDTPCVYTPKSSPECVVSGEQAYQVYLTEGTDYAILTVDELTSAFSVSFRPNSSANNRTVVIHIVDNCTGKFKDFLFLQKGANYPSDGSAF